MIVCNQKKVLKKNKIAPRRKAFSRAYNTLGMIMKHQHVEGFINKIKNLLNNS